MLIGMGRSRGGRRGGGRGRRGRGGWYGGPQYVYGPEVVYLPTPDEDDDEDQEIRGLGAETVQERTGTGALIAFVRAWKAHTPAFTAAELAGLLQMGADYGTKINAARPVQLFPDYDPKPLYRALSAAKSEADVWRGRMPWPWQDAKTFAKTDPKVAAVYSRLTGLYGDAGGVKEAGGVVRAAQKELEKDLTNPDRWAWWQKIKPFAIVGGVLVGAAVAYPYVKPLLGRLPNSAKGAP